MLNDKAKQFNKEAESLCDMQICDAICVLNVILLPYLCKYDCGVW